MASELTEGSGIRRSIRGRSAWTTTLFCGALLLGAWAFTPAVGYAQVTSATAVDAKAPAVPERSIDDLGLVGAAVTQPSFGDTVLGVDSPMRRTMFRLGTAFRVMVIPRLSLNLLDEPAPSGQQVYIGHRPTFISGVNPVFTWDLRQLGLREAQFNAGVGWRYTTWKPAGPNTLAMTSLYLYKGWGSRRVEMKVGYVGNDLEFVGLQVGGSTSTGAQGVYAVLPNEVGMSYFPFTAPAANLRLRAWKYGYLKTGAQRSLDPGGGASTVDRNPTGFRFRLEGNGLLAINEVGYQRPSTSAAPYTWVRAGYMRNSTRYLNRATGVLESGNACAYILADYQVRMPTVASPARGLFLGATAMTVPSEFNPYDRYYEVRLYQRGPFASRPTDVVSLVASYRNHSAYFTDALVAQGRSVWRNAPSLTGTYTLHPARGNYLSLSLGYVRGAAITPRVKAPLVFTANWSLYL
ncbi:MAG: carbohydrate porin [Acidobacteria bacterium]|nr:carbohydrate porin [Acidobacteriota bacterium]